MSAADTDTLAGQLLVIGCHWRLPAMTLASWCWPARLRRYGLATPYIADIAAIIDFFSAIADIDTPFCFFFITG